MDGVVAATISTQANSLARRSSIGFRVLQFLESEAVEASLLCPVLERHGLAGTLTEFCRSAGLANPCMVKSKP